MWMRWKLMSVPRADFTATVLPSGKVLLAGGITSLNTPVTATADLFDPLTSGITAAAPMKGPRSGHTATLLPNGKVLVAGGGAPGASALASAELYDPAGNTWSAAASMAYPRIHHTALLLWNGKVFVIGGSAQIAAAEVYDPGTNTWTTVAAPTNTPRPMGPTAIQLPEGHVVIVGGANGGAVTASSEVWVYDPHTGLMGTDRFHTLGGGRNFATATLLGNGTVMYAGGQDSTNAAAALSTTDIYDVAMDGCTAAGCNSFSPGAPMSVARCHHTMTTLKNGLILVVGGRCGTADSIAASELYDPVTKKWWPAGDLQDPRGYQVAVVLADGRVLVAGGVFPGGWISGNTEIYIPA